MGFVKYLPPEEREKLKYAHWACVGRLSRELFGKAPSELTADQIKAVAAACIAMGKVHPALKYYKSETERKKIMEHALEIVKKELSPEQLKELGIVVE